MKVLSFATSLVIAGSLQLLATADARAATATIKVTHENRSQFKVISDLNAFNVKGACYFSQDSAARLGTISKGIFRSPATGTGASREVLTAARRKCVQTAQARGYYFRRRTPTPTPTKRPTIRPTTSPTIAPTRTPTPIATINPTTVPTIAPTRTATPSPTSGSNPPVPSLAAWESKMLSYGTTHCNNLKGTSMSFDSKLAATYYDAEWVFFQIADYTGDSSWLSCAQAAEAVYRDQYVVANGGVVPGYWNFSHGLMHDYLRTGDQASKSAVNLLATKAAFAVDSTPLSSTADDLLSREVAYAIMAYLNAETVGYPHRTRTESLVTQALGHLNQWFVTQSADYVRPFMFSLTAHALISYDDQIGGNSQILPALENGANWIWDHTWLPGSKAFMYTDRATDSGGQEAAPDLNMLIAPVYAWLYHQTGNTVHRDRADQIFAGGVAGAYLSQGKQFDQNYRLSFEYLKWRNAAPLR